MKEKRNLSLINLVLVEIDLGLNRTIIILITQNYNESF